MLSPLGGALGQEVASWSAFLERFLVRMIRRGSQYLRSRAVCVSPSPWMLQIWTKRSKRNKSLSGLGAEERKRSEGRDRTKGKEVRAP